MDHLEVCARAERTPPAHAPARRHTTHVLVPVDDRGIVERRRCAKGCVRLGMHGVAARVNPEYSAQPGWLR